MNTRPANPAPDSGDARIINGLRIAGWSAAALLLALPAIAMQFTREVNWGPEDFAVFGVMLAVAGGIMELAARTRNLMHVFGAAVAVAAGFFMFWAAIAVGINGDGATDLIYAGVLAVALLGALAAGFKSGGLSLAMFVAALAQAVAGGVSFAMGWVPADQTPQILGMNGLMVTAFLASGLLFNRAARARDA